MLMFRFWLARLLTGNRCFILNADLFQLEEAVVFAQKARGHGLHQNDLCFTKGSASQANTPIVKQRRD